MKKTKKSSSTLDVLSHFLVPETKILSEKEKTNLLKKYGIGGDQLPKISQKDPLVKNLGANAGDIICTMRDDGTGKYPAYRVVVEA